MFVKDWQEMVQIYHKIGVTLHCLRLVTHRDKWQGPQASTAHLSLRSMSSPPFFPFLSWECQLLWLEECFSLCIINMLYTLVHEKPASLFLTVNLSDFNFLSDSYIFLCRFIQITVKYRPQCVYKYFAV